MHRKQKINVCLVFFFLIFPIYSMGQETDADFVIRKIKVDYPAFADKTKGFDFDKWSYKLLKKEKQDTFRALSNIVHFFNDQHLQIYASRKTILMDTIACKQNLSLVTSYLEDNNNKRKYEGYWINDYNDVVIALQLKKKDSNIYDGFVIESRDSFYFPGTILCHLKKIKKNEFNTDYYSPLVKARYFVKATFRSDTIFTTGADGKWRKLVKYSGPILTTLPKYNFKASGKILDKNCYLLTIPINSPENADIVDSLIKADSALIAQTPNLIIDIRNNLGGKSKVYKPLLPIICTKSINKTQVYSYATDDDIQNTINKIELYKKTRGFDSAYLMWWLKEVKNEKESIGKFVLLRADTIGCDSKRIYPKNVALIINYACQSATELMILDFTQSSKVTLFGEHTMGAADYLDYYQLLTPSRKYALYMPTTKRVIKTKGKIDGKGIYPQVSISDNEDDWVQFVRHYYENK